MAQFNWGPFDLVTKNSKNPVHSPPESPLWALKDRVFRRYYKCLGGMRIQDISWGRGGDVSWPGRAPAETQDWRDSLRLSEEIIAALTLQTAEDQANSTARSLKSFIWRAAHFLFSHYQNCCQAHSESYVIGSNTFRPFLHPPVI